MAQEPAPGIYVNTKDYRVKRASTKFAVPQGEGWMLLTEEYNTGLATIRTMCAEKKLVDDPAKLQWD